MFTELANQVWTNSATGVAISNNTDTSIDGSSVKIVFSEATRQATLTFDAVNFSLWEELSLHIMIQETLYVDLFTMTIGAEVFTFRRPEFRRSQWTHMIIDCSDIGTAGTIVFDNLVPDLTIFVDYPGYRSVTYNCDIDIITALKAHINLDYDTEISLTEDATAGDTYLSLNLTSAMGYVNDTSVLELDDGAGTIEVVELIDQAGNLANALVNDFTTTATVSVICPVRSEDYDALEPDPICGIKVFDMKTDKRDDIIYTKSGSKLKEYLGSLGIAIYIDCSSKKKLLQMSREYNRKYGKAFIFLLDGEQVEIYLDNSVFAEDVIGNNPRMIWYYYLEPQPFLVAANPKITTLTLTTTATSPAGVIDPTTIIPGTTVIG